MLLRAVNVMIGELVGARYKVINVLGSGGFGHTYIAEDTQRPGNPRCVLKHLTFNSNDAAVLQQVRRLFQSEAESLEQLGEHDQIPRLLAYFEENEQFYLVQEFIQGNSLSNELTKGGRLSETEVIPLLKDVLEILEFVHAQSVIHRDIKPANLIRRSQDSRLVLIDFGAVKTLSNTIIEVSGETNLSMPVYTSGYAASEQCMGRPRFSSDLYALGMVGIQALTGLHPSQLPHDYGTSEVIWRDQATVSDELATILNKMTRYHFGDRYQTASEVLEALRQLNATAPTLMSAAYPGAGNNPTTLFDPVTQSNPVIPPSSSTPGLATPQQGNSVARSSGRKFLPRIGLALLGTLAIAILVRGFSQTPNTPDPTPSVSTSAASDLIPISDGRKLLNPWQVVRPKQEGIDHLDMGNVAQAIAAFESARQQQPSDPETLIYLNNARIGQAQSYQIAVAVPMGKTLESALEILRGVAQAQDEVNRAGGINGVRLKVAIADDASQQAAAQAIATRLANDANILAVIGHGTSDTSMTAAMVYQDNKLVMVSPVSSAVRLAEVGEYIFRTVPSDQKTAKALKDYLLNRINKRRVVIFHNPANQYSQSLRKEFKAALDYSGVSGIQIVDEIDLSRPDFDADDSMNGAIARKAEVLMLAPDGEVMDRAIRVIESNNRRLPILGGDSMFTPKLAKVAKEKAVGIVLAVPVDLTGSPFLQQSTQLWGVQALPTWRTALAYDATQALIAAMRQDPTRAGIQRIMASSGFSAPGVIGNVSFAAKGERLKDPAYVTVAPVTQGNVKRYRFQPIQGNP